MGYIREEEERKLLAAIRSIMKTRSSSESERNTTLAIQTKLQGSSRAPNRGGSKATKEKVVKGALLIQAKKRSGRTKHEYKCFFFIQARLQKLQQEIDKQLKLKEALEQCGNDKKAKGAFNIALIRIWELQCRMKEERAKMSELIKSMYLEYLKTIKRILERDMDITNTLF